ncbi:MAG: GWxTD domain-containing protein [Ignavibacteriales bacterium]|nr:GWxTD domain-containing protein [Ignavibacteriales bacterium]
MKKILISLFVTLQIIAQPDFNLDPRIIESGKFFNSEVHYFPSNDSYKVYYSYKISYSQLFFEKNDVAFDAGLKVNLEILDSTNKSITRIFDNKKITVNDFELTNSENKFLQGLLEFNLPAGNYKIISIISDETSKRERRIPPIDLQIDDSNVFLNPLVVENGSIKFDNTDWLIVTNNSNTIPFNNPEADLLLPLADPEIDSIIVSIRQGEAFLVSDKVIKDFITCDKQLKIVNDLIGVRKNLDSTGIKCFVFNNLSTQLDDGPIQLEIKTREKDKPKIFKLNVIWINKPLSLLEPENAIKFLELIEPKSKVSEVLGAKGDDRTNLYAYWKPKDPTPHTKYNELMNEFYSRIDYCEKNYRSLSGNGGAKSDRGKTYIKFGAPDSIDRYTNNDDKVVETWIFKKQNRTFLFIDKDGTGKFQLAEGK